MKTRFVLALVAVMLTLLPASAIAAPTANVTGPNTGDCLYGDVAIKGTATGGPGFRWTARLEVANTNELLHESTGTTPVTDGTITTFDARTTPDVDLRVELVTVDDAGVDSDAHTFDPTYDREAPVAPRVTGVPVISGIEALVEWTQTPDLGDCRSGQATGSSYVVVIDAQTGEGTGYTRAPNIHGIKNESDNEALTQPWLQAGRRYAFYPIAVDRAGNWRQGNATLARTRADYLTVLAGQVKKASEPGVWGVIPGLVVKGDEVNGPGLAQTITDARGFYRLALAVNYTGVIYDLTFGPGCDDENGDPLLPAAYCATGWGPAAASGPVLGQNGPARIEIRNKSL